jgi:hypothetical protein
MKTHIHWTDELDRNNKGEFVIYINVPTTHYVFWLRQIEGNPIHINMFHTDKKDTILFIPMIERILINTHINGKLKRKDRERMIRDSLDTYWNLGSGSPSEDRKDLYIFRTSPDQPVETYLIAYVAQVKKG